MPKKFNVNGVCYPEKHYMVELNDRLRKIKVLVDNGDYFVINRARQYGKTTTLRALKSYLQPDYIVISMSFQKMSSAKFRDEYTFAQAFARDFIKKSEVEIENRRLNREAIIEMDKQRKAEHEFFDLAELFEMLSNICATASRPVVLMIDEVDQASNNQVFMDFLGQIREYYLNREEICTFYSVVLAGVYDIKNLKLKIRSNEALRYNSPWNVAAEFDVDMSFSVESITTMLRSYEEEHHTGMDIWKIAEVIFEYTGGYPYLVSLLCKKIDEKGTGWNVESIRASVRELLKDRNTLFEDVIKNIRNNQEFSNLTEQLLVNGANVVFERSNPVIDLGVMFGILTEKDTISLRIILTQRNWGKDIRSVLAKTRRNRRKNNGYVTEGMISWK